MARLITVIAALAAITPSAFATPQWFPSTLPRCSKPSEEYQVTDISEPYYTKAESVGGSSCLRGEGKACTHGKTYQHSVGVTETISGGIGGALDIGKIFQIAASVDTSVSWSVEDATAVATEFDCVEPDKGSYTCGAQVKPMKVKVKGKVHRWFPTTRCSNREDSGWVDFEVEAPALADGGPNEESNAMGTFSGCILSCPDDPNSLDCDGVRSVEGKMDLCPDTKAKVEYEPGTCTAHITQHQRWQGAVKDKYMFSLRMYDGAGTEFYNELYQEVNSDGLLSVTSLLPYTVEIKSGTEDSDFVEICYAGDCFVCDDNDGGDHGCTLGNGDEWGYEDNDREGDFGFPC